MKVFGDLELPEREAVEKAVQKNEVRALYRMVIAVTLYHEDRAYAESLCRTLSIHDRSTVRGNAILGLGHLARRFKALEPQSIKIIEAGLLDTSEYVRGQAHAAADDAAHFMKLDVDGYRRT